MLHFVSMVRKLWYFHDMEQPRNAFLELAGIDGVFEALGRAFFLLDSDFKICFAGYSANGLLCEGAAEKLLGTGLGDLFQTASGGSSNELIQNLQDGKIEEGRRAFIRCPSGRTRLVSITAAPVVGRQIEGFPRDGAFFLIVRPAEEESLVLQRATTSIGFVAASPAMLRIVHTIEALHRSDATTLITGESGTGKEVVAKALHLHSPRRNAPFVAVNCAAFPGELLESELFGHVRGAFTGAVRDKAGRFELAGSGTMFLDEIGDMPLNLQVKLLRVIQERQYFRLGDTKPKKVEARIVAATNVDLDQAIVDGRFREDLYYRLKVVPIHVPPLRERPEDIQLLAHYLLGKAEAKVGKKLSIPADTMNLLTTYSWPGNVRELENVMEYAATFSKGQFVHVQDLPPEMIRKAGLDPLASMTDMTGQACPLPQVPSKPMSEKDQLIQILEQTHWNRSLAAEQLGVSRTTLWRKMKRFGLE